MWRLDTRRWERRLSPLREFLGCKLEGARVTLQPLILAEDAVISIEGLKNISKGGSEPLSLAVFGMSLGVGPLDACGRAVADFVGSPV